MRRRELFAAFAHAPRIVVALTLMLCAGTAAHGDSLYSNFALGYTDSGNAVSIAGGNVGGEYYAVSFTPSSDEIFSNAIVDLLWFAGTNTVNGYLIADNNGVPGTVLAALQQMTFIRNGLETFTCAAPCPVMNAGSLYWLELEEVDPNTDIGWYVSSTDLTNSNNETLGYTFYTPGSWWWPNEPRNVFEINGETVAGSDPQSDPPGTSESVPEPGTMTLGIEALAAMLLLARKFKHT